jgi:hypothetical protein
MINFIVFTRRKSSLIIFRAGGGGLCGVRKGQPKHASDALIFEKELNNPTQNSLFFGVNQERVCESINS